MKVSATGLLSQVSSLLPKRATVDNQADMYRFMLGEMIKNIEQVRNGEITLQGFAEFYCIVPNTTNKSEDGK